MYAVGQREDRHRAACEKILDMVAEETLSANIDTELLQEVLHVYRRRRQDSRGFALFERLIELFPDPFPITVETAIAASKLMGRHRQLGGRDAFHAAVVVENALEGIITLDRGFEGIEGVTRFDPKEFA